MQTKKAEKGANVKADEARSRINSIRKEVDKIETIPNAVRENQSMSDKRNPINNLKTKLPL